MENFANKIIDAPLGKTHLFFTGQAGFIIKNSKGQLLAIDLYLSDCVERVEGHIGFKRLLPKILSPSDIVFDVIITTHYHRDHFDIDSVPDMMNNNKTKLFAAEDCRESVEMLGLDSKNITYVHPGMSIKTEDFLIHFIDCDHGTGAPKAVGVVVNTDNKLIYEIGDTCLRLDRIDELKKIGKPDVLIAPINGAYGNMNEQECAQFADAIDADITVPCHFGMFASHGGNPGKFYSIMKEQFPGRRFEFMTMGESLTI